MTLLTHTLPAAVTGNYTSDTNIGPLLTTEHENVNTPSRLSYDPTDGAIVVGSKSSVGEAVVNLSVAGKDTYYIYVLHNDENGNRKNFIPQRVANSGSGFIYPSLSAVVGIKKGDRFTAYVRGSATSQLIQARFAVSWAI